MKTLLLKLYIPALLLAGITITNANAQDAVTNEQVKAATALATGSSGRINRAKAFELLTNYANQGNPRAMNGLGLMYIQGHLFPADSVKAIEWLTKAGEGGFIPAWNNLGMIYKYAHGGVKQDQQKAYSYFEKAAEAGHPNGYYNAGYMLYKGLGCKQDYEKAFEYFKKGAEQSYSPAMYMLGLCYRNGYGVERSRGDAYYWLAEATRMEYKFATDELEAEEPENPESVTRLRSTQELNVPEQMAKVEHLIPENQIAGTYEGVLVTYDWSGKNIIGESPLLLQLEQDGEARQIVGQWIEPGKDTILLQATREPDKLTFTETRQYRSDHYAVDGPVLFLFNEAEIQIITDGNTTTLAGNIRMYSPETMEPERPMYLSLRKAAAGITGDKATLTQPVKVYPSPFSNELNVSFEQTESCDVSVGIYNYSGVCVHLYNAGNLPVGMQHLSLTTALPAGTYIVKLFCGKKSHQVIVICNGKGIQQ